jgi:hypothetical protein
MPIGNHGACRLCWQQGMRLRGHTAELTDLGQANRYGQQLFLANMHYQPRKPSGRPKRRGHGQVALTHSPRPRSFAPVRGRQLALFRAPRTLTSLTTLQPAPNQDMAAHCEAVLREHAGRHGWSKRLTNVVAASLRALLAWQDTPGATIKASEAALMLSHGRGMTTVESTLEVLAAAGLLDNDRVPAIHGFFLAQIAGLPVTMTAQLQTWYEVMAEGSTRPPRRRPRRPNTIRLQTAGMIPVLRAWADEGVESLAEITPDRVAASLPAGGNDRFLAGQGLRSLFRVLRGRKEIFTNPAVNVPIGAARQNIPIPVDTAFIRDALNSPDPARAVAVALVAFHGLTARQIREILLTDVRDGRLTIDRREIPLAGPVRVRLRAYVDHRARRFPDTANPYLLVNRKSAPRTTPVNLRYPWHRYELAAKPLREDRILHEIHATGGDVRRICDLFGLSVKAAMRYTAALEHPDLRVGTNSSS